MRMSVKGHLALLVGVFVVALLGVALVQSSSSCPSATG